MGVDSTALELGVVMDAEVTGALVPGEADAGPGFSTAGGVGDVGGVFIREEVRAYLKSIARKRLYDGFNIDCRF